MIPARTPAAPASHGQTPCLSPRALLLDQQARLVRPGWRRHLGDRLGGWASGRHTRRAPRPPPPRSASVRRPAGRPSRWNRKSWPSAFSKKRWAWHRASLAAVRANLHVAVESSGPECRVTLSYTGREPATTLPVVNRLAEHLASVVRASAASLAPTSTGSSGRRSGPDPTAGRRSGTRPLLGPVFRPASAAGPSGWPSRSPALRCPATLRPSRQPHRRARRWLRTRSGWNSITASPSWSRIGPRCCKAARRSIPASATWSCN